MKQDEKTRVFFFEAHPLMILGIEALIEKDNRFDLCGYSSKPDSLIDELKCAQPHVIILDLPLYTKESLDLIARIRKRFPELGIVLLSIHAEPDYAVKARRAGADSYVLKVEDPERILEAVHATVSGQNYISSHVRREGETPPPIDSPINLLSRQQFRILQQIGKGRTNRQIAEHLDLPLKTVDSESTAIQEKLDLSSPIELLQFAFHWVHHEGGFSS